MTKLQELREKLKIKSAALAEVFKQAGPGNDMSKVTCLGDGLKSQEITEKIRGMNNELSDIGKEIDGLVELEKMAKESIEREESLSKGTGIIQPSGGKQKQECPVKTFGEMFVESKAYTNRAQKAEAFVGGDMELKTLFATTAGWAPETTRTGKLVLDAQRPIQVVDIIPIGATSQSSYVYMEETTFTNAAAEASEGNAYAEAALALTEQSSAVRKIAVFIPVTDEQLEDVAGVTSYIDSRLRFMIQQRLDLQILVGDGNAPNLLGLNSVSGIQTQAKGADSTPDAIYKAMTKIRVTGQAMPNAVVIHPNDWQAIRLLTTADGIYIWGSPADSGPERIWGVQVVQAQAQTENTALVGDYANFCMLAMRKGVEVQISDSHDDYFVKGKQAIRARMRAALPCFRPAAFCTVTGI